MAAAGCSRATCRDPHAFDAACLNICPVCQAGIAMAASTPACRRGADTGARRVGPGRSCPSRARSAACRDVRRCASTSCGCCWRFASESWTTAIARWLRAALRTHAWLAVVRARLRRRPAGWVDLRTGGLRRVRGHLPGLSPPDPLPRSRASAAGLHAADAGTPVNAGRSPGCAISRGRHRECVPGRALAPPFLPRAPGIRR
jgi:hypothetical protein